MDPLSVIASSLAISEALGLGIKTLRGLANTSSEFSEMLSELSSLQSWMDQLRTTVDKIGAAGSQLQLSDDVLSRLELIKLDLSQIVNGMQEIQQRLIGDGDQKRLNRKGEPKVSVIDWQRSRGKVQKLRDRTRRCREDLSACLDLVGISQQLQQHQTGLEILTISHTQYSLMQSTLTRFESRFDALESVLKTEIQNGLSNVVPEEPVIEKERSGNRMSRSGLSASMVASSTTNIQVPIRETCARYCRCQCHRNTAIRTPSWSWALIGSLMLQFNGTIRLDSRPCDVSACRSGKGRFFKVAYSFPDWTVRRAIFLSASWGALTDVGASLHLTVPRVNVPGHVFDALHNGDVEWLRETIANRKLLPTDISGSGDPYLNYAIQQSSNVVQVVRLLLTMGFNPSFADSTTSQSAITIATRDLLSDRADPFLPPEQRALYREIVDYHGLDEREGVSTHIRDVVLGIASEPLEDVLAVEPPGLVNELDDIGYSPLHWAATLGHLHQARLLLASGADIDLRNRQGRTALTLSMIEGNAHFTSFILAQNGSVKTKDSSGRGILHYCRDAQLARSLLDAGADPNDTEYTEKRTPLHALAMSTVARNSNVISKLIRQLVQGGANLEARDIDNKTALLYAVKNYHVNAAKELHQLGARVDVITNQGRNLVHLTAAYGNLGILNYLREIAVAGVNPDLKDSDGYTPMDDFKDRMVQPWFPGQTRPTQQHVFAFYALISEIRERNWESGLFLESKEEPVASGELESIRRWLGWQWQELHNDLKFGNIEWDQKWDPWPDLYTEEDDTTDYDTAVLFGNFTDDTQLDLQQEEDDDDDDDFFDAIG